jgi:hypothetical protein
MRFALKRSIVASAAALLMAIVLGSASPEAVGATAGAALPTVKACVVTANLGGSVGQGWPVAIWAWNGTAPQLAGTLFTDASGCVALPMQPYLKFYFNATKTYREPYMNSSGSTLWAWMGSSAWYYVPNTSLTYQLPLIVVTKVALS